MALARMFQFGVPGDDLLGDSTVVRMVLTQEDATKKVEVPEAREAIDLHIPKEDGSKIKTNFKRQEGSMELVSASFALLSSTTWFLLDYRHEEEFRR